MELTGVRLLRNTAFPKGTYILLRRRNEVGHFLVIRPVGPTGRSVQVLDGIHEPVVIDSDRFSSQPGWTGLALTPSRDDRIWQLAAGIFGFICLVWLAISFSRHQFFGRVLTFLNG